MQPEVLGRSLEALEGALEILEVLAPAVLGYEEHGGLSDPGPRDCAHCINKEDPGYTQGRKKL